MPAPEIDRLTLTLHSSPEERPILTIHNGNPFRILDLRLHLQGPWGESFFDIGSIDGNSSWRTGDKTPRYAPFVPAAFYEGQPQVVDPALWDPKRGLYTGQPHHALVWPRQEETAPVRRITAEFPKQRLKAELTVPALGPRIAFSGHSFTGLWDSSYYYLRELAAAGGWNAQIAYDYWGGTGLAHHAGLVPGCEKRAEQTEKLLAANEYYDFYITAGNSDEAVSTCSGRRGGTDYSQRERMAQGARILYDKARQKNARMILWATHAYRYGFFRDMNVKPWEHGTPGQIFRHGDQSYVLTLTRDEMTCEIERYYRALAEALRPDVSVAPIGRAYALLYGRYGDRADPYQPRGLECGDDGHQNNLGNYLAACVLYGLIFSETPEGLPAAPSHTSGMGGGITGRQAAWAQQIAWEALTDSSAYPPCCG